MLHFEQWYEDHVKYMHTADWKPWMHEAWDAGAKAEREKCKKVLMAAHELSKQYHNYYHYIALQLDEAIEKIK